MATILAPVLLMTLLTPAVHVSASAPCDWAVKNCLPSCKTACRTAKCLYKCHYDTVLAVMSMAITPPEGPSMAAFNAAADSLGHYFDANVVVRVDPLGVYKGAMEIADYVATYVHPLGLGSRARVNGIEITHFVNTGNVSAATVNLLYSNVNPDNVTVIGPITKLTGIMFNTFDNASQKIVKGDWNLLRLPFFQTVLRAPEPRVSDAMSAAMIRAVCGINEQVCRPLGFSGYDNVTDCTTFMASIPRIDPFGIQGNNQYCRFLHMAYATVDPKLHCPHISKSGGGVCVNQDYNAYYTIFQPGTFMGNL